MRLIVVLHLHSYSDFGTFSYPLNDLLMSMTQALVPADTTSIIESCNTTHSIQYVYFGHAYSNRSNAVHVYRFYAPHYRIPVVQNLSHTNLFFTLEPPSYLPFSYIPSRMGYSGIVSFRESDTIFRPILPKRLYHPVFDPKRNSIGMWVDNCRSVHRTTIMKTLLNSNLNVMSMGTCLKNNNQENKRLNNESCSRHRIMLAVEHSVCENWISPNFVNALRCGAIPLVYTKMNIPSYPKGIPFINAANSRWMTWVNRIMTNDTYYKQFVGRVKEHHILQPNFHCQWFNVKKQTRIIHWPACRTLRL